MLSQILYYKSKDVGKLSGILSMLIQYAYKIILDFQPSMV
jgi:hypothetical protein